MNGSRLSSLFVLLLMIVGLAQPAAMAQAGPPGIELFPDVIGADDVAPYLSVFGTDTNFTDGVTEVRLRDDSGSEIAGAVVAVTVFDATSLDTELNGPFPAGTYTLEVATGAEVVQANLTVVPGDAVFPSAGPLQQIAIGPDLACSLLREGVEVFFGSSACGTFVSIGAATYGPNVPAGPSVLGWDTASQTSVTGSGAVGDPFTVTTTVGAGDLTLVQRDEYVDGQDDYTTTIMVTNDGVSPTSGTLYRAADCTLSGDDDSFGVIDVAGDAVSCDQASFDGVDFVPTGNLLTFRDLSPADAAVGQGFYNDIWSSVSGGVPFGDVCECDLYQDTGLGLSWSFTDLAPDETVAFESLVHVDPLNPGGGGFPSVSISPDFLSAGYAAPVTIDAFGSNTTFQDGVTFVRVLDDFGGVVADAVDQTSVMVVGSDYLTFDLIASLPAGFYSVEVTTGDEVVTTGLTVAEPYAELSPNFLSAGYGTPTLIDAYGYGTSWDGTTTAEVLDEVGDPIAGATANVVVASPDYLTFDLVAALPPGAHTVVFTTGDEVALATLFVEAGSIFVSPFQLPVGFGVPQTMTVFGSGANFGGTTTVEVRDNEGAPVTGVSDPTVASTEELSFDLTETLPVGFYEVTVTTGGDVRTDFFTVVEPGIFISPSLIEAGYPTPQSISVNGSLTSFDETTQVAVLNDTTPETGATGNVQVFDAEFMTFDLVASLGVGSYTVQVTTGDEVVEDVLTVEGPSPCSPQNPEDVVVDQTGLTNVGFETGDFTGWTQGKVVDGIEVVGADGFTAPFEGTKMARLGNTAASDEVSQTPGRNEICQDFVVDQSIERFVYRTFTYDYVGFDEFEFTLRVTDPSTGQLLASQTRGAFGSGTSLKSTPWLGVELDLAGHIGDTVRITLSAGGTSDSAFAFWAYIDSAENAFPVPVTAAATSSSTTGSTTVDPETGLLTVAMPFGDKSDLTLSVSPVCSDDAAPSTVTLFLGTTPYAMTAGTGGTFQATIPANEIQNGSLNIEYACADGTEVQPLGQIVLYDPSGFITDADTDLPIVGAIVDLYRVTGWSAKTSPGDDTPDTCQSVDSKSAPSDPWDQPAPVELGVLLDDDDPGISPNVNPFITDSVGHYGWDVSAGCYFVVVSATGYETLTSPVVGVPPEVTDLDLQLQPIDVTAPVFPDGAVVQASDVTGTSLTLNWTPAADADVVGYRVFQDGALLGTSGVSTTYAVTGLTPATSYDFTIVAVDDANNASTNGPSTSAKTLDTIAPTWPGTATLTASDVTETSVTLTWSAATDNVAVDSYQVFVDGQVGPTTPAGTRTATVTGLSPDTVYVFSVEALDAADNVSDDGPARTVRTAATPDPEDNTAPTWPDSATLTASEVTATAVTLSWSSASDNVGVDSYQVFVDGTRRAVVEGPTTPSGTRTVTVTGLAAATSYVFTVEARDAAGNTSDDGPSVAVTTTAGDGGAGGGGGGAGGGGAGGGGGDVPPVVDRIAGETRILTAALVSRNAYPTGADVVLLARADAYPDALAGAPLAAKLGGPILLTDSAVLSDAVRTEIQRLGASRVVLLGGQVALQQSVVDGLVAVGIAAEDIQRLAGENRFDTAGLVAAEVGGTEVFVTEGSNPNPNRGWPDAVAVSGLAAHVQAPILLVTQDTVPAETAATIASLGVTSVTIIGGEVAVSDAVSKTLGAQSPVVRLAGETRYETSLKVAEVSVEAGMSASRTWFATGRNFPDALAAGPAVALDGGVLLLTSGDPLGASPTATTWLTRYDGLIDRVVILGGPVAIGTAFEDDVTAALGLTRR